MIIYPAIDLKDGEAVRLKEGDMSRVTVFNKNPAAQARAFEEAGFEWLHLVDLNGAFAGEPVNVDAVKAILEAVTVPVQLGGGIRNKMMVDIWFAAGISRVILGTAAVRDPDLVREAARAYPGQIAVGIDARNGRVAVEGWAEASELEVIEMAKRFEGAGIAAIIYTDIGRDGLLTGINVDATAELAGAVSIPVIASGGLSDIRDIHALKKHVNIEGVIAGRALYDGRLDVVEALALAQEAKSR